MPWDEPNRATGRATDSIVDDEQQDQKRGAPQREEPEDDRKTPAFKVHDRRFWTLDEEELAAEEATPRAPTYIEQLEAQVAEKDQQLREYIAAYKKEVVEELEQTKRRLQNDALQQRRQVVGQVAGPMMEVLEALERSIQAAEQSPRVEAVLQGVKLVQMLMEQKLKEIGLERIESVGRPFDPAMHEAVAVAAVDDPAQDNLVVAELAAGFALEGRVFRPSKVQVGKHRR